MPIVYLLTNPAMPGLVKIGYSDRTIQERMSELSRAVGVPLPFECFLAVETADAREVEQALHRAFADKRKNDKREFFEITPDQPAAVLSLFQHRTANASDVTPKDDVVDSVEEQEALNRERKRRSNFRFSLVGITPGETLNSVWDDAVTCEVLNERDVKFRNETHSLSSSALILAHEKGYKWSAIAGPTWWKFKGKVLTVLRDELENEPSSS
jgi:T5orf172 domain